MRVWRPRGPNTWLTICEAPSSTLGWSFEARRATHRAFKAHDLLDPIEAAKRGFELRDRIERAQPKRLIALLNVQLRAHLAFELQVSGNPGQLPGHHQQISGDQRRRVIADRRRRRRQLDTERTQTLLRRLG